MTKLLLLDMDGTVRESASGATFINEPRDQKVIEGVDDAIAHYHERGWTIVGVTNQGGVAAGFKSLEDAIAEQRYTLELLPDLLCIYICPDMKGAHCWMVSWGHEDLAVHLSPWGQEFIGAFRKPQPGMLNAAIKTNGSSDDKSAYWYVGDRDEDRLAATAAGVNFLDAAIWRSRFLPGLHELEVTAEQMKFLEGL